MAFMIILFSTRVPLAPFNNKEPACLFLGLGVPPPAPTFWGGMLSMEGRQYMSRQSPWMVVWLCVGYQYHGLRNEHVWGSLPKTCWTQGNNHLVLGQNYGSIHDKDGNEITCGRSLRSRSPIQYPSETLSLSRGRYTDELILQKSLLLLDERGFCVIPEFSPPP